MLFLIDNINWTNEITGKFDVEWIEFKQKPIDRFLLMEQKKNNPSPEHLVEINSVKLIESVNFVYLFMYLCIFSVSAVAPGTGLLAPEDGEENNDDEEMA
ncbi:unnamed protein product [Rotaria socialis]|uniref:Uncharacterized protein n=1 Tax=Rotaria socialis TaxID=392032 RepID=A0A820USB1_9BILA|nr:unnamed protein product [Rotaria socialis]